MNQLGRKLRQAIAARLCLTIGKPDILALDIAVNPKSVAKGI
jgi:hypothetical protein